MAKNPVCPIYYNDLTNSTKDWSDEEFGAYCRLLFHQWDKGSIPEEMSRLTRISESAKRNWKLLSPKFLKTEEGLKNPVMEAHRETREKFTKKQQENVLKRYQNGYQNSTKQNTRNLPLENENENEEENNKGSGFFLNEISMELELTIIEVNSIVEFIQISCSKLLSETEIKKHWKAFKIDNFKKKDWYASNEKLISHFRHSLKNELNKKKNTENEPKGTPLKRHIFND